MVARDVRVVSAVGHRHHIDQPSRDDEEDQREQRRGQQQPGSRRIEKFGGGAIGYDRSAGRRFEMPRPAWIVVEALRRQHQRLPATCSNSVSSETCFALSAAGGGAAAAIAGAATGKVAAAILVGGCGTGMVVTACISGTATRGAGAGRMAISSIPIRSCFGAIGTRPR